MWYKASTLVYRLYRKCTILYCTVLYSIVLYCIVLYSTVEYCTGCTDVQTACALWFLYHNRKVFGPWTPGPV